MSKKVEIQYASESLFKSFQQALDEVAKERIYIEMINAVELDKVYEFQNELISKNLPTYYAICEGDVVGWADITPAENPRLSHRGFLGMGIVKSYRSKGIGTKLLQAALDHAKKAGLEKVELSVYADNLSAINLYTKLGFQKTGYTKNYRKLDDRYFDCIHMEIFF